MERLTYMNNHPEKLKNGATVIQKQKVKDGWVVLAMWKKCGNTEYITWLADDTLDCYWGHYHFDIVDATEDFKARVLRSS